MQRFQHPRCFPPAPHHVYVERQYLPMLLPEARFAEWLNQPHRSINMAGFGTRRNEHSGSCSLLNVKDVVPIGMRRIEGQFQITAFALAVVV